MASADVLKQYRTSIAVLFEQSIFLNSQNIFSEVSIARSQYYLTFNRVPSGLERFARVDDKLNAAAWSGNCRQE